MSGDLQRQVDELRGEVTALRERKARRLGWRRRLPLGIVALLVGLVPLSLVAAGPTFSDLGDAAAVHRPNIQAIGDAGITTGFEDAANPGQRTYNPKGLVTREEMASFLARTAGIGGNPPVANAKTAQTASNADKLGGKFPTDYLLAGQPVANATNAAQLGGVAANAYALKTDLNNGANAPVYYRVGGNIEFAPGTLAEVTITNNSQSTQRWEIRGQFSMSVANNDPAVCPCSISAGIYGPGNLSYSPQVYEFYSARPIFRAVPIMVMVYAEPGSTTFRLDVTSSPSGLRVVNPILIAEYHPVVITQP